MPDQTMEEETITTDSGAERTSEPHVVVACPSCSTKFAVESSLIASYEVPRFHCSRCDSIFELQQQRKTPSPSNTTQQSSATQRWVLTDESQQGARNDDRGHETPSTDAASVKSTDFTLGAIPDPDTFRPRAPLEQVEDRAGLSILGFRPTASRKHSTSLTRTETQSLLAQAGITQTEQDDPFSLFDSPGQPKPPQQVSAQESETTPISSSAPAIPAKPTLPSPPSKTIVVAKSTPPSASTARPTPAKTPSSAPRQRSARTQGLMRLSIPVLACIGTVFIVSVASRLMPLTMDSVFGAVIPGVITGRTAHLPPPELSVQDLNMQLEKTQSKETIPVIRGYVSNASDKTFEDVSIEALGFNSRGELIVRARAPLRSALSREKISDLPLTTVKKFQNALSASDASIKGGEKVSFSVALLLEDATAQEVIYFSARVFSVGKTR
jgi:hypothetical protein